MRLTSKFAIPALAGLLFSTVSLFGDSAAASWPIARHDAQRTGLCDGVSDIVKPVAYWKTYLGGQLGSQQFLATDLDGDGTSELVYVRAGRVAVKHADDHIVWQSDLLGITSIAGVADLDGDGRPEVIAYSSTNTYVFDGVDGALRWAEPDGEMGTIGTVRVADVLGNGRPSILIEECGCCGNNSNKTGFVYDFSHGSASPKLLWSLPSISCSSYHALTVFQDDTGAPKVLHSTYQTLQVLDGVSGAVLAETPQITTWLAASDCAAVDLDGEPGDELVCFLNISVAPATNQRKVYAVKYTSTPAAALNVLWQFDIAPDAGGDVAFTDPIADLDGDGSLEIVVSGQDATGWTTFILDALTGAKLAMLPGQRAAGSARISPGTGRIVLTTSGSTLNAYSFSRTAASPVAAAFSFDQTRVFDETDFSRLMRQSVSTRLVAVDLTGAGRSDLLTATNAEPQQLSAIGWDGTKVTVVAKAKLPKDADAASAWSVSGVTKSGPQIALGRSDGFLEILGQDLTSTNAPGVTIQGYYGSGSWGDVRRAPLSAKLDASAADAVLVLDSRGSLDRFDAREASLASPPLLSWSRSHTVSATVFDGGAGSGAIACFGEVEPVSSPPQYEVRRLNADGTGAWSVPIEANPLLDVVPVHLGNGAPGLAVQWGAPSDTLLRTRMISSGDGSLLWDSTPVDPGFGRQPAGMSSADWNGDGVDDLVMQGPSTRVLSGVDGTPLLQGGVNEPYYMPTLFDVDGDGVLEVTLHGGADPARTLSHDLSTMIWHGSDDKPYPYGAVAQCPAGPLLIEGSLAFPARIKATYIGGASIGQSRTMVLAQGKAYPNEMVAAADGARLGQLTAASTHANLTGNGSPTTVVGSAGGHLYGLDTCAFTLQFVVDFGYPVGEAIFGDTDGDGRDEILVTTADGFLYDLKNEAIAAPKVVRDVDPKQGWDLDVDVIHTDSVLYCSWTEVPGALGYQAAIVDKSGHFLSNPHWKDVSANRETFTGLELHHGTRYFCAVRAMSKTGPSVDALSDGVVPESSNDGSGGAGGGGGANQGGSNHGGAADGGNGGRAIGSGGCSCEMAGLDATPPWLLLGALGLLRRKRRRLNG